MQWFRNHIIRTNIILITVEVILASLIWFSGAWFFAGSRETFGPLNSYIFIWLSIIIASMAVINSIFATTLANETQRPWIYMIGGKITSYERNNRYTVLPFILRNSGSLPATNVCCNIDFFANEEKITEDNNSHIFEVAITREETPMLLPNDTYTEQYVLDIQNTNDRQLLDCIKQGKAKVRFRISYESFSRKHLIIQTYELSQPKWEESTTFIPIPPQKWK
jgi:hypothetical protein